MSSFSSTVASINRTLWEVWGEPILTALRVYEPADRTYGRWNIPFSPMERRLHENPDVSVSFGKAMMPNGKDFVWYQIWEDKQAQRITGRKADMIFVHGTGVHSGTLASHSRRYLDAGFRLLVPDLPSHGFSTGLHVYQRHLKNYSAGLRAVLHDVAAKDDAADPIVRAKADRRSTFMLGLSFGGLVSLSYGIHYPASLREDTTDLTEIPIDGLIGVGPMIGYSTKNFKIPTPIRLWCYLMEYLTGGGRLEVIVPHKKCLDKDPKVYKTLVSEDKRSHQGAFRVGHLFCINDGMEALKKHAHKIRHPLLVQHGGQDRVAEPQQAIDWVRSVGSDDKRITIYPVCQHVIYRKAKTEQEDRAGRVAVIEDNVEWMCERSIGEIRLTRQMSFASDMTLVDEPVTPSTPYPTTPMTPNANVGDKLIQAKFFTNPSASPSPTGSPLLEATKSPVGPNANANANARAALEAVNAAQAEKAASAAPHFTLPEAPKLVKQSAYSSSMAERKLDNQMRYRPNWNLPEELRPYDVPSSGAAVPV